MEGPEKQLKDEGHSFDEGGIERKIDANLLTNYEATMAIMEAIEGPGWLRDQPKGVNIKYTLDYVMNWLKTAKGRGDLTTLYGCGGGDRYLVRGDGSVEFKASFGTKRTLSMARSVGFPIEEW